MSAEAAVEAFFVISGFYMALTFEAYYREPGGVGKFYLSRLMRLYPLHFAVLLLMSALYPLAQFLHWQINATHSFDYFQERPDAIQSISVWSLFFQDMLPVNEARALLLPLRQAWSISAELMFYLLTPALLALGNRELAVVAAVLFAVKFTLLHSLGFRWPISRSRRNWATSYWEFWFSDSSTVSNSRAAPRSCLRSRSSCVL